MLFVKDLKAKTDVIGKRGRQKRKVEGDSNLKVNNLLKYHS